MGKQRDIADSAAVINYLDGITSSVQTQLDAKAKYDDATANFTGTLQNGGSDVVVDSDIGSTVQAYDADTAKYDDATANFTGTLQNGGSNVVVDSDIGSTVQAYDADTAKYDDTTANFTGTLQNGGSNVVVDSDIGSTVQAYDSNLTSFVSAFTLPTTDGTADQVLTTNGSGTLSFADASGGGGGGTLGTLTKTFVAGESATITLTSSVLAPVVSVTKEVSQTGVTNNSWDVTGSAYTLEDSAYSTTLDFTGFDVSTTSFVDSFSVSAQDTDPRGIAFNTDGTKMFIVGNTGDDVNEYTLSTGFDVSTASYSQNFSVSAQDITPTGIAFNTDGTKMFIVGLAGQDVNEYTLSTGFDVSTASYSQNFSVSAQETFPQDMAFNTDGTKMFILGSGGDDVNEYTLSTGFDISTASYSQNFSVSAQDTFPTGIAFNTDGTKMFIVGSAGDDVNEYTLSTGFDVSTATYSQNFSIAAQDTEPRGIAFNTNGSKMFIVGSSGDDVNEYTIPLNLQLGTGSFASTDVGKTIEANSGELVLIARDGSFVETTAPTSYDQVASGSWSMYGVVYDSSNDYLKLSGIVTGQFDISTASYSQNFSVAAQDISPQSIAFNTSGTKMFIVGISGEDINEYTLSTAFDVSTASFVDSFSVSSQESTPTGIAFNTDGTKMFIVGAAGDDVNEYTLSTGFDVSTASYSQNFSVASQETEPQGIAFNTDGTKMFIVGSAGDDVNEYTLSTGFDVSTASYSQNFSVSSEDTFPVDLSFNTDGTKMFIVGGTGIDINEYTLSTGFDVSTASFVDSFSVSSEEAAPRGIAFNNDGSKMFIVGNSGDDVNEYDITLNNYIPSQYQPAIGANIDTTYWTDINSLTATDSVNDGAVYYAISDDSRTTWSVQNSSGTVRDIARNNAGTWEYNSNGTFGSETWTSAKSNTEIQALRDAMITGRFDVSTATYSQNFSVSAQEAGPLDIAFNADGTKMFIIGYYGDDVNEYILSVGFDVSTASYSQNFSVSETNPTGIAFNTNGTKMFIIGTDADEVKEYTLSTGFDVSTASYSQNFDLSTQETFPTGIAFNTDGTKMFIVGQNGDDVSEYTLSTGFDVSTASYSQNFSVLSQEATSTGIAFNTDGTKMFIVGSSGDDVNEYTLSTGFDVSTASYSQNFSVSAQDTAPQGITFNTDGTKMFIVGSGRNVNEYTLGEANSTNQMPKATLNALTDAQQITLGNDLDFAVIFYLASGTTVPTYSGTALNYDANVLNKGAVLGTDYDFDAPAQDKVRITALANNNLKVRVV